MIPRKYRVHIFLAIIALVIIFYPSFSRKPDQERLDKSSVAATEFFSLVDAGKYQESWDACSAYLKNEVEEPVWSKRLAAVRTVAGALIDRKQKDYTYTNNVGDSIPVGEYMVYHFDSQFANKDHLVETVTVMLEEDKHWRIAGYFIE